MSDLEVLAVYCHCTLSQCHRPGCHREMLIQNSSSGIDPPYSVYGGLFHEEAIMLLRRFYIQENDRGKQPECSSKIEAYSDCT